MLHKNRVFDRLRTWHDQGEGMVLATVTDTEGSTYSKAGDFILIAANGDYQGLVSGGCVEGDLATRAAQALASRTPAVVDYDLGGEHDALWGMGAGCDGRLQVLLTPLYDPAQYAPLLAVADAYRNGISAVLGLGAPTSSQADLMTSASAEGHFVHYGVASETQTTVERVLGEQWLAGRSAEVVDNALQAPLFVIHVRPAPRVLLCGAAPDAEPLARLLGDLGWHVTVYDHRPAYIDAFDAGLAAERIAAPAAALAQRVALGHYPVVVVMSHHLDTDTTYLRALARHSHWHYVGLLGPVHRRERLLNAIGDQADAIRPIIDGPAGLPLGAKEPAGIALSIAAGIHARLAERGAL
ncbi:MAG: XdhC family protein [Pseudomonadota bacterium]